MKEDSVRGGVTLTISREDEVAIFRKNPSWWWLPMPKPKMPVHLVVGKESAFLKEVFLKWQNVKWGFHLV